MLLVRKHEFQLVYLLCWVDVHANPFTEGRVDVTGLWHGYPHLAQNNMWLEAIEINSCGSSICSVMLHSSAFSFPSILCLTNKQVKKKRECHIRHKGSIPSSARIPTAKGFLWWAAGFKTATWVLGGPYNFWEVSADFYFNYPVFEMKCINLSKKAKLLSVMDHTEWSYVFRLTGPILFFLIAISLRSYPISFNKVHRCILW